MGCLDFKSNRKLMALKTSNSFGDQIIAVVDITKDSGKRDPDFPYMAGVLVGKIVNIEGEHMPFTEKAILKRLGLK